MGKLKIIFVEARTHVKTNWKLLLLIYVPILLLFTMIAMVSRLKTGLEMSYFTRDITAIADVPFYAGLVSQLGVILWSATAAICLFSFFMLRLQKRKPSARRFLFQAGILTTILLLDDVYLFHDSVVSEYLHMKQTDLFLVYFVWVVSFLLINRKVILASEYWILIISFLLFGASIFFDVVHLHKYEPFMALITENRSTVLEDAPKLAGIATWLLYFTKYAILSQLTARSGLTQGEQSVQFRDRKPELYHERSA